MQIYHVKCALIYVFFIVYCEWSERAGSRPDEGEGGMGGGWAAGLWLRSRMHSVWFCAFVFHGGGVGNGGNRSDDNLERARGGVRVRVRVRCVACEFIISDKLG